MLNDWIPEYLWVWAGFQQAALFSQKLICDGGATVYKCFLQNISGKELVAAPGTQLTVGMWSTH